MWMDDEGICEKLLGQATRLQAAIHACSQIGRKVGSPRVNVAAPNRLGEAQSSVDDIGREHPEVCRDVAPARIFAVKRSNEDGGRAGRILLVMDAALGEHCPLELAQLRLDRGVKSILLHERGVQSSIDHGEEFVGAGMYVRNIKTTRLDERNGTGDAELFQDGEVVDGGKEDGTTLGSSGRRLVVEIENRELAKSVPGEECSTRVREQGLQSIVNARFRLQSGSDASRIANDGNWAG